MKWTCDFKGFKESIQKPYHEHFVEDVYAIMEMNCTSEKFDIIDIELTVRDYEQDESYLYYDYYVCTHKKYIDKNDGDGWNSYSDIDFGEIEPKYFTTEDELKTDMYKQLKKFCESKGIVLTESMY